MTANLAEYQMPEKAGSGFWEAIGIPARGARLHQALRDGIPYTVYKQLVSVAGLEHQKLAKYLVIAPATLRRRAKAGKFKVEESDRLYRFAEVLKAAIDLFEGDREQAVDWLSSPVRGLGERRPVDMLATSAEAKAVLDLIGRLEHGVFP